jgi:hypothetical protein
LGGSASPAAVKIGILDTDDLDDDAGLLNPCKEGGEDGEVFPDWLTESM